MVVHDDMPTIGNVGPSSSGTSLCQTVSTSATSVVSSTDNTDNRPAPATVSNPTSEFCDDHNDVNEHQIEKAEADDIIDESTEPAAYYNLKYRHSEPYIAGLHTFRRPLQICRSIPLSETDSKETRHRSVSIGSLDDRDISGPAGLDSSTLNVLRTNDSLVLADKDDKKLTPTQQLIKQLSRTNSLSAQSSQQGNQVKRTLSKLGGRAGGLAARINRATSMGRVNQVHSTAHSSKSTTPQLYRKHERKSSDATTKLTNLTTGSNGSVQFVSYIDVTNSRPDLTINDAISETVRKDSVESLTSSTESMTSHSKRYWRRRRRVCGGTAWAQFRGASEVCLAALCVAVVCSIIIWHREGRVHPAFIYLTAASVLILIVATAYLFISAYITHRRKGDPTEAATIHRASSASRA